MKHDPPAPEEVHDERDPGHRRFLKRVPHHGDRVQADLRGHGPDHTHGRVRMPGRRAPPEPSPGIHLAGHVAARRGKAVGVAAPHDRQQRHPGLEVADCGQRRPPALAVMAGRAITHQCHAARPADEPPPASGPGGRVVAAEDGDCLARVAGPAGANPVLTRPQATHRLGAWRQLSRCLPPDRSGWPELVTSRRAAVARLRFLSYELSSDMSTDMMSEIRHLP